MSEYRAFVSVVVEADDVSTAREKAVAALAALSTDNADGFIYDIYEND